MSLDTRLYLHTALQRATPTRTQVLDALLAKHQSSAPISRKRSLRRTMPRAWPNEPTPRSGSATKTAASRSGHRTIGFMMQGAFRALHPNLK